MVWYLLTAAFVVLMVVVGGITRLTHSGLSMVEWRPLMGTLPPMSVEEWTRIFDLYKQSPEYIHVNTWMTLEDFKGIFWWEYSHRLLGRLVGIIYALPLFYFSIRRTLTGPMLYASWGILVLGALQGVMGWVMVKSGLVNDPAVSQYRLVAHFFLALLLIASLLFAALNVRKSSEVQGKPSWIPWALLGLVGVTLLSGGFVSGLKAGLIYNTFPLMGGGLIPEDYGFLSPFILNFFENPAAVQFNHRFLALLTYGVIVGAGFLMLKKDPTRDQRRALILVLHLVTAQVVLGISTLLLVVPVHLAAFHQFTGVMLLCSVVYLVFVYSNTHKVNI